MALFSIEDFNNVKPDGISKLFKTIFKDHQLELDMFMSIYNDNELALNILYNEINLLTDIQQAVIKLRYGLDGNIQVPIKSIAQIIDRSVERVRQIHTKSIYVLYSHLYNSAESISIMRRHEKLLPAKISILNLPTRIFNALMRYKIVTVSDILETNAYDLMKMRNFGAFSLNQLMGIMKSFDFNDWADSIARDFEDATTDRNITDDKLSKLKPSYHESSYKIISPSLTLSELAGDYDGSDIMEAYDE